MNVTKHKQQMRYKKNACLCLIEKQLLESSSEFRLSLLDKFGSIYMLPLVRFPSHVVDCFSHFQ